MLILPPQLVNLCNILPAGNKDKPGEAAVVEQAEFTECQLTDGKSIGLKPRVELVHGDILSPIGS